MHLFSQHQSMILLRYTNSLCAVIFIILTDVSRSYNLDFSI